MARLEPYTDEYIAKALKEDARERSAKYSSLGLQAFLPNRQKGPTAKPNTRFLQNILRDTDNHNAALLAKERREAREKQKRLSRQTDGTSDIPSTERVKDEDRRKADKHRKRRRREEEEDLERSDLGDGRLSRSRSRSRSPPSRNRRENKGGLDSKTGHRRNSEDQKRRDRGARHSNRRKHRGRSLSPEPGSKTNRGIADKYCSRKEVDDYPRSHCADNAKRRSPRSSRSPFPPPKRHRVRSKNNGNDIAPRSSSRPQMSANKKRKSAELRAPDDMSHEMNDSDPLEDLVGPLPPSQGPKRRGRGAAKTESNIDEHFASTYDPSADISPGSGGEGDDWEDALEAFRDRQKWKQIGAKRLREAGFSEDDVKKWESGANENARGSNERDVKWVGKGEGREWDRGKVLDYVDGTVKLEPEWGRLKGT